MEIGVNYYIQRIEELQFACPSNEHERAWATTNQSAVVNCCAPPPLISAGPVTQFMWRCSFKGFNFSINLLHHR